MRWFCDVRVAFLHFFRWLSGSLNFYQIFSKFLYEMLKCREMSIIVFEIDPSIFTVFGMTSSGQNFSNFVKLGHNKIKICISERPWPPKNDSGFIFFMRQTTSGLAAILFFPPFLIVIEISQNKINIRLLESPRPPSTNLVVFFSCNEPLPV